MAQSLNRPVAILAFLCLYSSVNCVKDSKWKDPHDMGFDIPSKISQNEKNTTPKAQNSSNVESLSDKFLARHVKSFLRSVNSEDLPEKGKKFKPVSAFMTIKLSSSDLKSLHSFAQLNPNASHVQKVKSLHQVESTFEKVFKTIQSHDTENYEEMTISTLTKVIFWLESHFEIIPLCISAILAFYLWRGLPIGKLILSILVISCGWEWGLMVQKVKAERFALMEKDGYNIPRKCAPESSSFLKGIYESIFPNSVSKDCVLYQEYMTINAYLEVNPSVAVVETFSKLLLQPLGLLGEKIGLFFNKAMSMNSYMASPFVAAFCFAFLIVLTIIFSGYTLKLPWFLGSIEPSRQSLKFSQKEETKKLLLEVLKEFESEKLKLAMEEKKNVIKDENEKIKLTNEVALKNESDEKLETKEICVLSSGLCEKQSDEVPKTNDLKNDKSINDKIKEE